MRKTKEIAKLYKKVITEEFSDFLKALHFKKIRHLVDDYSFTIIYRCEERYILFHGNLHFRDFPYWYYLSLGEGNHEFPEKDWNSISLLWIIKNKNTDDFERYKKLLSIDVNDSLSQVTEKIKENRILLEKYGKSFLNNNLDEFRKIRAAQNQDRESYKVYAPNEDGKYSVKYEETSSKLKEKYSK